jgi:hypothetical protein
MSTKVFGLALSVLIVVSALVLFATSPRWVYGYVRDAETNEALPGVAVAIGSQETTTDAEGYFQLGGIRGLSTVRAAAGGYNAASVALAVANLVGTRREITLRLQPNELRGTVTDAATRAPLEGATVRIAGREVQTDKKGRYSIKRLLPGGTVTAYATYFKQSAPAAYTGQAVQDFSLTILPTTVTVRDDLTGDPIAGATVKAGDETLQSDAQGRVIFAYLQPQTQIVGSLAGYKDGQVTASPGDNATLTLRPPIIKGTVQDTEGRPLADATVVLRTPGQTPRVARSDAEGHYLLAGLPEQGTIIARKAGYKRAESPAADDVDVDLKLEPFMAKGIYIPFGLLMPGMEGLLQTDLDLVDRTELNAVVIDVKSDEGWLAYTPTHGLAQELDAGYDNIGDLRQILQECKRRNIYTIARIVVFKDSVLAEGRPEWAVHRNNGGVWRDAIGTAWMDPFRQEVWEYNLSIAKDAIELGFDEIQFDYLRFPSDGDIMDTNYVEECTRPQRVKAIADFAAYSLKALEPTGAYLSLDLFGLVTSINLDLKFGDLGIGQELAPVAPYADYISPMVYPSTYEPGNLELRDPQSKPYEVVKFSIEDGRERAGSTLIRPWLQHYSLGVDFGAAEFRLEKQAATEAGAYGWLFWNAGGMYEPEAFDPQ